MTLIDTVATFCESRQLLKKGDTLVVGVSGGADSLALLAILHALSPTLDLKLHVAHLNHQLRKEADADAEFVAEIAQAWQLPITIEKIDVAKLAKGNGQSLEDAARNARYRFLGEIAKTLHAQKIAVGHNADDQVETVLLHFMRGAGIKGLGGMHPDTPLANDNNLRIIRPLLNTPRAEIDAFCRSQNLNPRFDASNADEHFTRNKIRHSLLPMLKSINPAIADNLRRTANLMTADDEVLQAETERSLKIVTQSQYADAIIFDKNAWRSLLVGSQRRTLRRAIEILHGDTQNIEFQHIEAALSILEKERIGAQYTFPNNLSLIVDYTTFILAANGYAPPPPGFPHLKSDAPIALNLPGITSIPQLSWKIHTKLMSPADISIEQLHRRGAWHAYFDASTVGAAKLRPRIPGDKFVPFGLNGQSQKLNKFMIDQKIPLRWRDNIPLLLAANGEICWVCGWRTAHHCRVTPDTREILSVQFKQ